MTNSRWENQVARRSLATVRLSKSNDFSSNALLGRDPATLPLAMTDIIARNENQNSQELSQLSLENSVSYELPPLRNLGGHLV
jgi:hypothetical protein